MRLYQITNVISGDFVSGSVFLLCSSWPLIWNNYGGDKKRKLSTLLIIPIQVYSRDTVLNLSFEKDLYKVD